LLQRKKKLNSGKLVSEFIDTHYEEKIEIGSFDHKGELTPEIVEFGKKLPKNTHIGLPELADIVTRAKAQVTVKDQTSRKQGYHASEW